MPTVTSADGSTIAYDRAGSGPTVVFVSGAFNDRSTWAPVAALLQDSCTTVCIDRRGRGDSRDAILAADVASYEVTREVEDLDAVIAAEGGRAAVVGFSSGANLALYAAASGSAITRLALYEAPFALGGLAGRDQEGLRDRLARLIVEGERGEAVATMQTDGIGLPAELVEQIKRSPMWPSLEAIAQTVVYDATITGGANLPTRAMTDLDLDVCVLAGKESWEGLRSASAELPSRLSRATYVEVEGGADHGIPAQATAAALRRFLVA
ncbi:alpha/beta fold hydrolase [Knoellia sp. CPCC 206453]|uniref:alpha/beta fold hydrolase n=1 Tax=Knoellia pratensis TaxID=3404796 RepID=UPI00361FB073